MTTAETSTDDYDRPTEPNEACEHKETTHWHGTRACYVFDRCRCADCRAANTRYGQHRMRWTGEFPRTTPPLVSAGPVRRHLRKLGRQGMGYKRVAELTGIAPSVLSAVLRGRVDRPAQQIRRDIAEALLATVVDVADGVKVDGTEARAIHAELRARGWTNRAIAAGTGQTEGNMLTGAQVTAGALRRLRLLLDEPVPPRNYGRAGLAVPDTGHTWQHVPASTPGVPATAAGANRILTCAVCGLPLADHSITQPCTVPR